MDVQTPLDHHPRKTRGEPSERTLIIREIAKTAKPEIFRSRRAGCYVATSLNVAEVTAHQHSNIVQAAGKVIQSLPDIRDQFWIKPYTGRDGQIHDGILFGRMGLAALFLRLRPVAGARNLPEILNKYRALFDQAEEKDRVEAEARAALARVKAAPPVRLAEALKVASNPVPPAPDAEIRPPETEHPAALHAVDPDRELAPSWAINAAILLLTKRANMPLDLAQANYDWNSRRLVGLVEDAHRRGEVFDQIAAIYATRQP
jgi:hypothetical protein